jgi:hypothetical protein
LFSSPTCFCIKILLKKFGNSKKLRNFVTVNSEVYHVTFSSVMKVKILLSALFVVGGMSLGSVFAVPPPPSSTPPPTSTPSTPTGIPLDGGVLLLAAAGAAYGIKNIYANKGRRK